MNISFQKPNGFGLLVIINTYEFGDEKAGIAKYISAVKTINDEFTPVDDELKSMNTKLECPRKLRICGN